MKQPFFSIVIPIYNISEDYFTACMQSLTQQTFGEIEIVLVDDGSGEACATMCDRYAQTDERIRVIHQPNQGVSAARNHGIEAANGEWIMFVDADDWLEQDACQRIRSYVETHNCDMVQFNGIMDYASSQKKMNYGLEHDRVYDLSNVNTREWLYRRTMSPPNTKKGRFCPLYYSWDKAYKATFLKENPIRYPVGIPKSEDKVFILKCFSMARSVYSVEDVLYHYRINAGSVSHKYSADSDKDRIRLGNLLIEMAGEMDEQMAELKGVKGYDLITRDCYHFLFGIASTVLMTKFYHPDAPMTPRERAQGAKAFLKTEPFRSAIKKCEYGRLATESKIKKFLLSMGMVSVFSRILQKRTSKKNAMQE